MTATVITERSAAAHAFSRSAGLRALVRKDATEWLRGRRAAIVLVVATLWTVLAAANAWIITQARTMLPADVEPETGPASLEPLQNLLTGFGSQVFVLAAVFAVASLIVRERESGTLAWVASKPVARESIWLSKWLSSSAMLAVAAVIAPLALTVVAVVAMYGMPDLGAVAIVAIGGVAAVVFYAALGLAAGTVLPGQPAIVAVGLAAFALVPALLGLIPLPLAQYLPTSIVQWSIGTAVGADVGWVTPVAWAAGTALVVWFGVRRMARIEL
jgi:ABC-type transport system involved in multi-copper enzyme maturation permease subunit